MPSAHSKIEIPGAGPTRDGAVRWEVGTLSYCRASLSILFFWLLGGDFAINLRGCAIGPLTQLLLKEHHASDALVGLLMTSLPCGIGVILGPWLSVLSDRHRGPRGRRIPFLLIGTPFATLAPLGIAVSPLLGRVLDTALSSHSPGYHPCVLIVFVFFLLIFDVANGFTGAGFGGLVNDVVPRPVMGRFQGLFRAVGLLAGVLFNYFLMGGVEKYSSWLFAGTAAIYGLGMYLVCFQVREGDYPPPPPHAPNPWAGISTYFRECYSHRFYLLVFTTLCVTGLAFAPVNSFSIFYAKSIGMSMGSYGKYLALTYICSFVLAYPFGSFADRYHPLGIGVICMACYTVIVLLAGFFATDTLTFAIAFVLHGVLSGCYASATASLTQRLYPKEKFAQFAAAGGVFGTPFWMILPPLVGVLLDWSGHVYRYTFLMSGILGLIGTLCLAMLYYEHNRIDLSHANQR